MKISPWLAGAAAVILGFSTSASAAVHHPVVPRAAHAKGFRALSASMTPLLRHLASKGINYNPVWAGYVAAGNANVALRYVGADFNVPSLNCADSPAGTSGAASVVQSVGLDGYYSNDSAYEATGIFETCTSSTTAAYSGWYQIGTSEQTSTVTVNPGDAIQASIYYNLGTKQFIFDLNDVTTGQPIVNNVSQPCPAGTTCPISSAEAVTGVANGTPPQYTLADYGMANFTGGAVTSRDGVKGGFGASKLWTSAELGIHDINANNTIMASPSSLEGGSAFNTTWHAAS
jgi:hypothetical protein